MTIEAVCGAVIFAVLVGGLVLVNVCDRRRRAMMTPEQLAQEDEESRAELQIW